jgi:hypothetical protein
MPGCSIAVVTAELAYVFCTANMKKSGVSVSSENTSQKIFISNDTISENVRYQSVSITKKPCKINSLFSSSHSSSRSEEQVFQLEPSKGGREHAGPFCGIT